MRERNVAQQITNAYDSVNLINDITKIEIKSTPKLIKRVDINSKHLELMLTKVWFTNGLESGQSSEIESCIAAAQEWINKNNGAIDHVPIDPGPDTKK